ncbi:MAG: helix-turn-helix transcriptional regulator [Candidatus Eremiobacteraeota bacterium]|nr:helix-turn-helix transcriptional regulator [Candidatus Eremiobacteraeota bacterium]MBV8498346.1 helix-turn-helix transcriptional regulator [Candidatus Eremiobacteraeota bacterium]
MAKKQLAPEWFGEMRRLYGRCQFLAAGDVYDEAVESGASPAYEAQLLAARILLKRDENRAVAFLIRRPPKANAPRERAEWALLLGIGYARMRDFERADHHFEMVRGLARSPADKASLSYQLARRSMLAGELADARGHAGEMHCDHSLGARIKRELLESFIFSHEERYLECAESTIRALDLIGEHRAGYLEEWFHAVHNIAVLGRELPMPEAADVARAEVEADVEWPPDLAIQHFQALKAVGWSCALRGDLLGCFRYLRAAERTRPSPAFEAIVLLDRAYFARILGERNWACDEIEKAEVLFDRIDWNEAPGDERIGLLLMAEAIVDASPEKAHYFLARFNGLDKMRSPFALFAFDQRCEAYAAYCEGFVRLESGEGGAEEPLRKAWALFDRIGYDWRAGRTALRLAEATGKERWRHLAEDKLEQYPRSWLAREIVAQAAPSVPPVKLPRMQRTVLEMLCRKMTTAQIAQDLGLSQHTVRNHLKAVFRAYQVNNRAALVAEVASRGDVPIAAARPSQV